MAKFSLKQVPLFKSLPESELHKLQDHLKSVILPDGKILFSEGDPGDSFYIILEGGLQIIKALDTPEESLLYTHGPGDFGGEMSLLMRDGIRSATVRTRGNVELLELSRRDFDQLLENSPALAYEMVRELGDRLRDTTNSTIEDLKTKNRELASAYDELKAAQAELVKKEKLEHELDMARNIQMSILPQDLNPTPYTDHGARMVPARAVGGDFYDFIPLEDNKVGIAIGDVSDKGVPAALFMAQLCTLLRVIAKNRLDPETVLLEINRHMLDSNQSGMFATVIYGIYDCKQRSFHYGRAGHEAPLVFGPQGNATSPEIKTGTPLCLFPDPPVDVNTIEIPAGHTLVMYTDGGTDAMNAEEQFFGLDMLKSTIVKNLGSPAQEICDKVIEKLLAFQDESSQFDDATLVALRGL